MKTNKKKEKSSSYLVGEVFIDKYLGCRFTEIMNSERQRVGWIWTHTNGKVVVAPHLGFYLWFGESGEEWTIESGAMWLVRSRDSLDA